jgi:hypothetical protein
MFCYYLVSTVLLFYGVGWWSGLNFVTVFGVGRSYQAT